MGFSSSLQGANDVLLARQDAEIRLVENIRRCVALRIKADREYAINLNSFVLQAAPLAKSTDKGSTLGSLTHAAWGAFVAESEKLVRHIKENADYLATSTIDKINLLYNEKKANRKYHAEEHSRIHSELHRLQEAVDKTRHEYERCLDIYQSAKAKYNEHLNSKGKSSGKRLEDAKEKYSKSCKKLYTTHNEYILLLSEASEFERDMRTILLPGLLEHQQSVQEGFVEKMKIILTDLHRCTNNANKKCSEMQYRVEKAIGAIRPADEYTKFIEVNKTSPPSAVPFKFDGNISECIHDIPGLSKTGVTLNETTIDSLKSKLQENEMKLIEARAELKDKQTQLIQLEAELGTVQFKADSASKTKAFTIKKKCDILKKEIQETLCIEQKALKQKELIQTPLSQFNGDQIPPLLEVCNTHQVPINNVTPMSCNNSSESLDSKRVMSYLIKPFGLRKAASNLSVINDNASDTSKEEVNTHLSTFHPSMSSPSFPIIPQPGTLIASTPSGAGISAHDSSDALSSVMTHVVGRPLEEELWFHGVLPRGEVVRLLECDGDFLVRETVRNEEKQIVLSVMWSTPKHFIVQTSSEGLFRFEGPPFGTVQELIIHQFYSGISVTSRSGAILKTPVLREEWELNNDDVELVEKIGRGNFGDVYKAQLHRGKNMNVAVKTCKITLPEEQKKKFLQEGRILKQYDHPNIVKFIGICVQKQPIMIVMELVPGGSLLNYLRDSGNKLTVKSLLGMCLDASAGMKYLESKNCIHRDLAARNCLVGEGNSVKISDFGMSREEEEYTVSDGFKQIPIKWTAPEALNYGKYTSLCDVWSFGVLCWEIFSKGGTPYQGMTNTKAREMLDSGYRMPNPENTPDEMYQLMLRCWEYEPEDRPHFPEIHATVDLLYSRFFRPLDIGSKHYHTMRRFLRRSVTFDRPPLMKSISGTALNARFMTRYDPPYPKWFGTFKKHFRISRSSDALEK